jgi:CheY-like chemotaxis protein
MNQAVLCVMVVDDDDDLREILAELLVDCGHRVLTASDGEAALRQLEGAEPAPDLIILDWMMPRMDGLGFRRRQLADPNIAAIPVVLMSATTTSRVPLTEIAPDAALTKPVTLADLLGVLERFGPSGA